MLVVADTSPLNYLVLIQQDTLLPTLYERVMIPPAVHEELQRPRTPQAVRQWVAHPPARGGRARPPPPPTPPGHEELQRPRPPQAVRQWVAHPPAWLTVQPPQQSLSRQQFPRLRHGELE